MRRPEGCCHLRRRFGDLKLGPGGLDEVVHPDHDLIAGLDSAHPLGVRSHKSRFQLVDRRERAAELQNLVEFGLGGLHQLGCLGLDDMGSGEDVVVLEQVRFMGQHLLDTERPLLIPGARQPERLVPRRELERPGSSILRKRDTECLQHDPLQVVLRLGLGETE